MVNQLPKQLGTRVQRIASLLVISSFIFIACSSDNNADSSNDGIQEYATSTSNAWMVNSQVMQGTTQGTTFTIKTSEELLLVSPTELSALLDAFDNQLSGYIDTSFLTKFNNTGVAEWNIISFDYFDQCMQISLDVFEKTSGAFDPSVFPLVKAWGFFKDMKNPPTDHEIDSILEFVSFENGKFYEFSKGFILKKEERFQIDFNAIAQGYSVDVVADLLRSKGHENFYIEIGGELYSEGVNFDGTPWVIGIDVPDDDNTGTSGERRLENYLYLSGKGLATSGNYRKFYEVEGLKYSHTLDPKTGRPVTHNLLSATVVAESAALADGYATAFMVMGVEETMKFVANHPELDLEVYLLFQNEAGRLERAYSSGMRELLGEG